MHVEIVNFKDLHFGKSQKKFLKIRNWPLVKSFSPIFKLLSLTVRDNNLKMGEKDLTKGQFRILRKVGV